jgi:hypothetical protein
MTYSNYYLQGMCVGLAEQGAVFEKCEYFQGRTDKEGCSACPKVFAFKSRAVFSLDSKDLELNSSQEVKC